MTETVYGPQRLHYFRSGPVQKNFANSMFKLKHVIRKYLLNDYVNNNCKLLFFRIS